MSIKIDKKIVGYKVRSEDDKSASQAAEAASDSEKEGSAKTIDVKAEEMKAEGAKTESKADGKSGGLEIKYVSLYKDEQKAIWLTNQIPDKYYWQIIQYLVAMPELSYVYLFAHLRFFTKLDSGWVFDHSEERLYPFKREEVQKDIELAEQIETSFWKENVKKKIEPSPVKED